MFLVYYEDAQKEDDIPQVVAACDIKIDVPDCLKRVAVEFIVSQNGQDRLLTAFVAPVNEGMYIVSTTSFILSIKQKMIDIVEGGWFSSETVSRSEKIIGYFRVVDTSSYFINNKVCPREQEEHIKTTVTKYRSTQHQPWMEELQSVISLKLNDDKIIFI